MNARRALLYALERSRPLLENGKTRPGTAAPRVRSEAAYRWLAIPEPPRPLHEKSLEELALDLTLARGFVISQVIPWTHRRPTCSCAACTWVRRADALLDRLG